jgi:hypothetical protein
LLTVLTPLAGLAVIAASTHAMWSLLDNGVNVFLYGGLFGTLIIVLNMCIFYLYTKLSVAHKALIFARDLTHTPPVWTPEQGLSVGFIEKYEKIRIFRRKNFMASVEIDFVVPDVLAAFETYSKVFGTEAVEKSSLERGLNENEVFEKASAAGFSTILEIQEVQMSSLPSGSKTAMQKDPWGYIWTSSNW